jgi:hypothetical protein
MSSPGSGFNHYFSRSPVTPHGQFLFYFIFFYLRSFEVRDICWRFIELLKFYSVIWQHCTLQNWCDIKYNTVLCWAKILSIRISNAYVDRIFSILDNTWTDRRNRMRVELVKSEPCTKFNFDMMCADFLDFLNKPEQIERLKNVSKNKMYTW